MKTFASIVCKTSSFYFQIMSRGFKAIFKKLNPTQDKSLSFASVWKSFNVKKGGATSSVESSSVLTSSRTSDGEFSTPTMPPASSSSVRASSDALLNFRSKASSKISKRKRISKEDQGKIQSYLEAAVRPSSKKTYRSYWQRYVAFCAEKKMELNTAEAISLFLIKLAESCNSKSAALSAKTAISLESFKI